MSSPHRFKPQEHYLSFNERGHSGYIKIDDISLPPEQITVSMTFREKPGTVSALFFYTSPFKQPGGGEFTIMDSEPYRHYPSHTSVYVNGKWTYAVENVYERDKWHEIIVTWDSTTGRASLFHDGVLSPILDNQQSTDFLRGNGFLWLGQDPRFRDGVLGSPHTFKGDMARLTIWDRVLEADEIKEGPDTGDAVHHFVFDQGSGTTIQDQRSGLKARIIGNVTWKDDSPPHPVVHAYDNAAETDGKEITGFDVRTDLLDLSSIDGVVAFSQGPMAHGLWTEREGAHLRVRGDTDGDARTSEVNLLLHNTRALTPANIKLAREVRGNTLDVSDVSSGLSLDVAQLTGVSHVTATGQADTITGDVLANRLEGRGGQDTLRGEGGNDTLIGGAGDDTLIGGLGADTLTGGADRDTFVYHSVAETVGDTITDFVSGEDTIDLSAISSFVFSEDGPRANALWTVQEGNDLRLMGDVSGTPHAPEINILFKNISTLTAADVGADVVRDGTLDVSARRVGAKLHLDDHPGLHKAIGTAYGDRLVGTDRDNTLHGRDGQDRMYGEGWDDHLYGEGGDDHLEGGHGRDHLYGEGGDDHLEGGHGRDHLYGEGGDDHLEGGEGRDYLDGGDDVDTADYSDHSAPIGVILRGARATKVRVDGQVEDTLVNIENVTGGSGDDRLVGDNEANVLKGLSGDDKLYGRGGNDILVGGHDKDYMDGGAGVDTADYSGRYGSIEVTLNGSRKVKVLVDGEEEDTIRNIENVIGGFFDDTLVGDDADNTFTGGEGYDTLTGNGGQDTFVYRTAEETVGDTITDFRSGEDVIDFSALEPLLFSANGARANSVWAAQDENGHLKVLGDTDGDTSTYEIDMTLERVSTITAADLRLGLSLNGDVLDARSVTDPRYLNISEQQDIRVVQAGGMGHVIRGNALNNILVGGAQGDTFTGGGGADTFVGDATSAAQDVITDFSVEDGDILQIVSATPLTFADTTPTAHGIWYEAGDDSVTVYADANGDGVADASWVLQGQTTFSAASVQVIAEAPTFNVQAAAPIGHPGSSLSPSSSSVRLDFSASEHGVAVSLADPSGDEEPELPDDGQWSEIIRPTSGESEVMGSPHPDWIVGNDEANVLNGSDEDDVIYGLGGADTLTGGAGEDRFVYQRAEEGGDTITDFTSGEDTIDLSVMAEDCGALEWSEDGALEYGVWQEASPIGNGMTLYADTDGDAVADFQVTLVGVRSLDKESVFLGEGW